MGCLKSFMLFSVIAFFTSCKSQNKDTKLLTPEQEAIIAKAKQNFVFVKGGAFIMGKAPYPNESPEHEVTLDSYSISKYETTFKEYDVYTQINKLDSIAPEWRDLDGLGPNYGAKAMTMPQAQAYCKWLGKQLQLPLDLPTEAQWEYAARSRGLNVEHGTNNGKIEGGDKDNYGTDRVVGSYPPNPLGLYDMSGGRPEWTRNWYTSYTKTPKTNPVQDTMKYSKRMVVRGMHTLSASVYRRAKRKPDNAGAGTGFRCVCNQETPIN